MRNLVITAVVLCGCPGTETTDKSGETATETGVTTDTETTTTSTGGFDIVGQALTIANPTVAAPEGLCVALVDPSPAILGKPAVVIAGPNKIGPDGAFSFSAVYPPSPLGLLLSIDDCNAEPVDCVDGTGDTQFTAATGIQGTSYIGLGKGDVLTVGAFSIDCTTLGGWEASTAAVPGYSGDLSTDGFMVGFVWDTSNTPISGATVSCADCLNPPDVWYQDPNFADGLFTTDGVPNSATDATGASLFLIPIAPIGSYIADDGGAHTFDDQLNGSNPGSAVVTVMFGN